MSLTPSNILRVICVIILACSLFYSLNYSHNSELAQFYDQNVYLQGTVVDVTDASSGQQLTLADIDISQENYFLKINILNDRILVFAPSYPPILYGQKISLSCIPQKPGLVDDFHYDRYLATKKIYATCFSRASPVVIAGNDTSFYKSILQIRASIIAHINKTFGEPHASLLAGLLLGENRFSEIWQNRFLQTGTTHIVAASGYNVSAVVWIVMGAFASIGVKRQQAFAFLIGAIAGYIILAGAEAAVVRAGVMGILVMISRFIGRSSTMFNVLLLTASVMLLINPLVLFNAGFQLSMLSTIALIYVAPKFEPFFSWLPKTLEIRSSVVATLSATSLALPVLILNFKSFSFVSITANLLILPLVPYAMASGAITIAVSYLNFEVAIYLSGASWSLLTVMLYCVRALGALPLFVSSISGFTTVIVCVLWLIVLLYLCFCYQKKARLLPV